MTEARNTTVESLLQGLSPKTKGPVPLDLNAELKRRTMPYEDSIEDGPESESIAKALSALDATVASVTADDFWGEESQNDEVEAEVTIRIIVKDNKVQVI